MWTTNLPERRNTIPATSLPGKTEVFIRGKASERIFPWPGRQGDVSTSAQCIGRFAPGGGAICPRGWGDLPHRPNVRWPFQGEPVALAPYFRVPPKVHLMGILGGIIWNIGMTLSIVASGAAGPAISYGLG